MKALTHFEAGKLDTTPLITHRFKLENIEEAYRIFENKLDGVIKIAVEPERRYICGTTLKQMYTILSACMIAEQRISKWMVMT